MDIKNINGNISYNKEGPFNKVNKIGVIKEVLDSFKKFASSIKLIINTRIKKTDEITKKEKNSYLL